MANISGSWLGTYWQNANPTRFEVTFVQAENTIALYPNTYSGLIAEDENSMQDSWTIQGLESGTWEAHRSGDDWVAELQNRRLEAMPLGRW